MVSTLTKIIFLLMLLVPLTTRAQSEQIYSQPKFTDPNRLKKIHQVIPKLDQLYSDYASKNHIPGYCYAIVVDSKLIHTRCDGYADINKKISVTPHTVFRVASLSKSFTAMAILKLRDAGKLQLDDPIDRYLPEIRGQRLTKDSPVITIRDLLTHASGFPQDDPWGDRKLSDTTAEFLAVIKNKLYFSNTTGTNCEYSNLGYTMLGYIINKVSNMPYQEYIAKNIWQPLSMKSATWEYSTVPAADLAHGYRWEKDHWIEEPILHDGVYGSMGGMMTSIEDFSKYVALHQNAWPARDDSEDGPVSRATLRSMQTPWMFHHLNTSYKLLDGTDLGFSLGYGYGLFCLKDAQFKSSVLHSGSLPGFHAYWIMLPDYGVALIAMGNIKNAPRFDINMQALNSLVKEAKLQPRMLPPSQLLLKNQQALIKLLPDWKDAVNSKIFATNFFLDNSVEKLQENSKILFAEAGKIVRVGEMVPENQLRGHFILHGEKADLKVKFTLAPEQPALIQEFVIEVEK